MKYPIRKIVLMLSLIFAASVAISAEGFKLGIQPLLRYQTSDTATPTTAQVVSRVGDAGADFMGIIDLGGGTELDPRLILRVRYDSDPGDIDPNIAADMFLTTIGGGIGVLQKVLGDNDVSLRMGLEFEATVAESPREPGGYITRYWKMSLVAPVVLEVKIGDALALRVSQTLATLDFESDISSHTDRISNFSLLQLKSIVDEFNPQFGIYFVF